MTGIWPRPGPKKIICSTEKILLGRIKNSLRREKKISQAGPGRAFLWVFNCNWESLLADLVDNFWPKGSSLHRLLASLWRPPGSGLGQEAAQGRDQIWSGAVAGSGPNCGEPRFDHFFPNWHVQNVANFRSPQLPMEVPPRAKNRGIVVLERAESIPHG